MERVDVPTALALFPADLSRPPRATAERTYNLTRYTRMPRGGHFAAHEEPDLLARDIIDFFRAHRRPADVDVRPDGVTRTGRAFLMTVITSGVRQLGV